MKKNVIALLLAVVMVSGNVGTVPALAAEATTQEAVAVEEETVEDAEEVPAETEDAGTGEVSEDTTETESVDETEEASEQELAEEADTTEEAEESVITEEEASEEAEVSEETEVADEAGTMEEDTAEDTEDEDSAVLGDTAADMAVEEEPDAITEEGTTEVEAKEAALAGDVVDSGYLLTSTINVKDLVLSEDTIVYIDSDLSLTSIKGEGHLLCIRGDNEHTLTVEAESGSAISVENFQLDSGNVVAIMNMNAEGNLGGVFAYDSIVINGGSINAVGSRRYNAAATAALYSNNRIIINGGVVETTGNNSGGIATSNGDVQINNGSIKCVQNGKLVCAIESATSGIKITGGDLSVNGSITARGDLAISGGNISVNSTDQYHDAITSHSNLYISGGDIEVHSARDGIYGEQQVKIDGGEIEVYSATSGIDGYRQQVEITGGHLWIKSKQGWANAITSCSSVILADNMYDIHYPEFSDYNTREIGVMTDIASCSFDITEQAYTYTGQAITPDVKAYDGTKCLSENTDYTLLFQDNTNAGEATITITGKNKYSGSKMLGFSIAPKNIDELTFILDDTYVHTGGEVTPDILIKGLQINEDYEVSYENNIEIGTAKVRVSGIGNYTGILEDTFQIIHDYGEWVITTPVTCLSNGTKERICSVCDEKETETILTMGHIWKEEYTVDKEATCTDEGSESIHCSVCGEIDENTVRAIPKKEHTYGDWTVTKEATCIEDGIKEKACIYCDDKITESINATGHTWSTEHSTDKEPTYTEEGSESIHCSVCGEIKEGTQRPVAKLLKPVSMLTISGITAKTYNGKAQTQAVVVKDGTATLKNGTHYTVSYKNNTNAGTASVVITGKGNYTGTVTKTFTINKAANAITAGNFTKAYSTKAQSFSLGAKATGGTLTYASNNKSVTVDNAGKVTVKAKFIGNAAITITAQNANYNQAIKRITITVNPNKTALSSAKNSASKKMTVKWKKNAAGSGYQIQYSTAKNFKGAKTVTIKKNKIVTKTIGGLKKGKKYYVRVRTYKAVGKLKFYSGWSTVKKVAIKK